MSEVPLWCVLFLISEVPLNCEDRVLDEPASGHYRSTSLIRNSNPLGPYSRTMPRALWWS